MEGTSAATDVGSVPAHADDASNEGSTNEGASPRAYRSNENYYEDYVDALHAINITQKHEVVDEVEDVHRLRRAWYYTLFIVFGLIILLCILVLNQAITLPRRFPTLFCWQEKFLDKTQQIKECRGADLTASDEWSRPNVTATQLGLLRAFPSLYSALNALTIFKFVPDAAGEFLQLCLAKFGAQCPYLVWRGTWTKDHDPLQSLRDRCLPDPQVTGSSDNPNQCDPWQKLQHKAAPVKFAGMEVACQWRCWLGYGMVPSNKDDCPASCDSSVRCTGTMSRGWFKQTCGFNPFYDWFSKNSDAFFRTPSVVEYVSLLGTPQLSSMSKLYSLYAKGLVAFAIEEIESSSSMSGLDLFNFLFNPSTIIRGPPQDCSNVKNSTTWNDASSAFGIGSMALPFMGPIVGPVAAIGGGIGAYTWGNSQGKKAEQECKDDNTPWTVPTNPPKGTGGACATIERMNCMTSAGTSQFVIDPFPCTNGFES
jgi:hypothetical protein